MGQVLKDNKNTDYYHLYFVICWYLALKESLKYFVRQQMTPHSFSLSIMTVARRNVGFGFQRDFSIGFGRTFYAFLALKQEWIHFGESESGKPPLNHDPCSLA